MAQNIEEYVPVVKYHGLNTDEAVDLDSTLNVQGATTLQSTLAVTGAITASGGITGAGTTETTTTTDTLTAAQSGTTIFLGSATGFVTTLPAPAAGLEFTFIVNGTPPTSGNHTIVTASSANIIEGNVTVAGAVVAGATEDTISFVASTALAGDWVKVVSDGTNWFVSGQGTATGAITLTQAS